MNEINRRTAIQALGSCGSSIHGYTLRLHKDFLFPSSKLLLVERDVSNGLEIAVTNFVL